MMWVQEALHLVSKGPSLLARVHPPPLHSNLRYIYLLLVGSPAPFLVADQEQDPDEDGQGCPTALPVQNDPQHGELIRSVRDQQAVLLLCHSCFSHLPLLQQVPPSRHLVHAQLLS